MWDTRSWGLLLVILLVGPPIETGAQQRPRAATRAFQDAPAVDKAVLREMEEQGLVGVAVGVIRDNEVVYLKGYGWADREDRVRMTRDTVINWASNSKPMAAVLALQLVERGELELDADVRKYVPEFPEKGAVITTRHLLCHQSGIPHYSNGEIVPSGRAGKGKGPPSPMRSLDRFGGSPLIFRPGERCEYSSYAYILLSAVVERAGKQAYDEQVRERIRRPLGLDSLQLDHAGTGKNWSVGYDKKGARVGRQADEANDWKFGAGGYKSDVGDFAAWALSLLEHRLVPDRLERLMWTPQDTDNGQVTEFGLGFEVDGKGKDLRVAHNGLQGEATTRMVLYPEQGHGIVVMTNCGFGDPGAITTAIYRAMR